MCLSFAVYLCVSHLLYICVSVIYCISVCLSFTVYLCVSRFLYICVSAVCCIYVCLSFTVHLCVCHLLYICVSAVCCISVCLSFTVYLCVSRLLYICVSAVCCVSVIFQCVAYGVSTKSYRTGRTVTSGDIPCRLRTPVLWSPISARPPRTVSCTWRTRWTRSAPSALSHLFACVFTWTCFRSSSNERLPWEVRIALQSFVPPGDILQKYLLHTSMMLCVCLLTAWICGISLRRLLPILNVYRHSSGSNDIDDGDDGVSIWWLMPLFRHCKSGTCNQHTYCLLLPVPLSSYRCLPGCCMHFYHACSRHIWLTGKVVMMCCRMCVQMWRPHIFVLNGCKLCYTEETENREQEQLDDDDNDEVDLDVVRCLTLIFKVLFWLKFFTVMLMMATWNWRE